MKSPRPRVRRSLLTLVPVTALLVPGVPTTAAPPTPPPAYAFMGSGLAGGGFVNVIAVDPFDPDVLLAGGDVSGFHRSVDGGAHWTTSNTGLTLTTQLTVATIAFSPTTPGLVYAGVGWRGIYGGFLVSTDGGVSWNVRSGAPRFSGSTNEGIAGVPAVHPRSTGTLLALDEAGGHLYAATFEQGVLRSDNGGATWSTLGLVGKHLRGLAFDPASPGTLYVGAYADGVYRTTTASTTGTFTKLTGSPVNPEELTLIDGSLYVAGGKAGIFRSRDQGATWARVGGATVPTGPIWMSVAGYQACGHDVIYAGAHQGGPNSILRSTDDGATWASLTPPTRVHPTIGGPGGETWWLVKQSNVLLGGGTYVASQLAVAPPAPQACLGDRVLVAGRAGVWGTTDAGVDWYPMVRGMGLTISRDVMADPALAGRTYVATADWVFHYSVDELATVVHKKPPGGTAADVAIEGSTTPGRVYVAVASTSGNSGGEVFSSANPVTSGWTDEGLSGVAGGKRPLAIVVRKIGAQRILIAAVDGGGVWRKAGTTWTKVSGVAMAKNQPSRGAALVWPAGTNTVYLYDHETGVWRSNDAGRTWAKIWSKPSSFPATGYLAVDPAAPGRLFVSVGWTGVYRIDGATTGSVDAGALSAQEVGDFAVPGPVEFDPAGDLYVAAGAAAGSPPGLFRSVDGGVGWASVDDAAYDAAGGFPFDLAFAPDGTAFLSTNGDGVLVGVPT